ncbi:hypothetical protein PUR71_27745 [Streptomyces sp. SP17BM10]|uniref:hypothetical protein n=1 Tax=Streptomyces sp. SP17BM10 TaxID=3002530 RepID=UPI002E7A46DE|nr:hypothetical protein [Streptomyces sp. SP17BM10]MEE1786666.1 hypothetical protein [Streptomyces sp. SP17BM10]
MSRRPNVLLIVTDEERAAIPRPQGFTGLDRATTATRFPALHGHSLAPALEGAAVREGVLTTVESITTPDAGFWSEFADPQAPERIQSGSLRPDWSKRGFLRGFLDQRYTFGRYFSPLEPNRPTTVEALHEQNDVVLYDRVEDPDELRNLAADPAHHELVAHLNGRLEDLISAETGTDTRAWVTERPRLLGWPTWHGDTDRPAPSGVAAGH